MDEERGITKYEYIIDYLLSSVKPEIKEDLKQELYMLTWDILNSQSIPDNIDSYIFIALKNKRNKLLKQSIYQRSLSLNVGQDESDTELLDSIVDEKQHHKFADFRIDLDRIMNTLTDYEKQILDDYFFNNLKESEIAKKYGVTQQSISKTLRKALKEIQSAFRR